MFNNNNDIITEESYVLKIVTIQIIPFRTLIVALKDILVETNIIFQPDGMKIINMDASHKILINMKLPAENFQEYVCKKEKIVIGVSMTNLFKLINTVETEDTLTLYIEESDYSEGVVSHLGIKFENGNIRQCKTQKLRLIEPDNTELEYPDVHFSSIINLPSSDFQKIIKDLSIISDHLEIKSVGNELIFKCSGQFASAEIHRLEKDESMTYISRQEDSSHVISGVYSLKILSYFIKCTNLCQNVELYMENNLPFVVKYECASLGYIYLCLSAIPFRN